MERFQRFGDVRDLERGLVLLHEAVASAPQDASAIWVLLYRHRFELFGEVKDISSAIQQQLEAIISAPLDSADRPGCLK